MKNKLRLLVTRKCNRSCEGCCNKYWDLSALPVATNYVGYDEILLTGGEPMLDPLKLLGIIGKIKEENKTAKIYLYTAKVDDLESSFYVLSNIDGICVTLHEQKDVSLFYKFPSHDPGMSFL